MVLIGESNRQPRSPAKRSDSLPAQDDDRIVAHRNRSAIGLTGVRNVRGSHRPAGADVTEIAAIDGAVAIEENLPCATVRQANFIARAENGSAQIRDGDYIVGPRR